MNDFGESFPHKLHYRRRRRSLNDDLSGLRLHYRIDAFGERFHLNLTADSSFIAPSYTVTHLGEEQSNDTDSQSTDPGDMRHCFFRGHVNAKSEYPAVFSLCTGLVSTWFPLRYLQASFLGSFNHSDMLSSISTNSIHARTAHSSSHVCKCGSRASVTGLVTMGSPAPLCLWEWWGAGLVDMVGIGADLTTSHSVEVSVSKHTKTLMWS